jgi:hypothetical protein
MNLTGVRFHRYPREPGETRNAGCSGWRQAGLAGSMRPVRNCWRTAPRRAGMERIGSARPRACTVAAVGVEPRRGGPARGEAKGEAVGPLRFDLEEEGPVVSTLLGPIDRLRIHFFPCPVNPTTRQTTISLT